MPLTHLAMAFAISHPGVTSALVGPLTMAHLDDLLAGVGTVLDDKALDRIDEIVPPGTEVGRLDMAYDPPAITTNSLRHRPVGERAATENVRAARHSEGIAEALIEHGLATARIGVVGLESYLPFRPEGLMP